MDPDLAYEVIVHNTPLTHTAGPVAENVKAEAARTSNELSNLANARNQRPEQRAATGQHLTHYHSFFFSLFSWENPRATAVAYAATIVFIFGARYLAHAHPAARQVVVELDGRLAELVREWFDLPRAPLLRIRVGEARAVTESLSPATRDVVVRDVFAGAVTPEPLTTVEFARHVRRVLAPGGLYVLNCGDTRDLAGARAELAALSEVFEHVAAVADPAMLKGRRYGNIVLAASSAPLPLEGSPGAAALGRELLGGAVPAQYKDEAWVRSFVGGTPPRHDPVAEGARDGA